MKTKEQELIEVLNNERYLKGLTLDQIAKTSGLHIQTVYNCLSAGRHSKLKTFIAISLAIGFSVNISKEEV